MKRLFGLLVALIALFPMTGGDAEAMDFRPLQSGNGQRLVLASGEIVRGDAQRLAQALLMATPDRRGTRMLLLDSPGGLVGEALAMSEVMDRVGVTVVVPGGAICASACASILFVSGRYRSVDKGGALVIHSCYDARNGRAVDFCDALISVHAQQEGASGVAMMAMQEAAGTDRVVVLGQKSAACFGLSRNPGSRNAVVPPCVAAALRAARRHRR